MTRPKPKFTPEPRFLSAFQVACLLGWSESTFAQRLPHMRKEMGFPPKDDFFGGYDVHEVNRWIDRQLGKPDADPSDNPWDEAIADEAV